MPKSIKAKMVVESVKSLYAPDGAKSAEVVELKPVYSNDPSSENYSFSKYTPHGKIELVITNPDAWGALTGTFILDFTPVTS